MLQSLAFQKLHGDEGFAILLANVVNGADVWMVQRGSCLRLALKAGQRLGIASHLIGQEFQGHKAVEAGVFGLVDHAHAAAAELFDDTVVRDDAINHSGDARPLAPYLTDAASCSQRRGGLAGNEWNRDISPIKRLPTQWRFG